MQPTNRAERVRTALTTRFAPDLLDVIDESAQHAGHSGARAEGETHYRVHMVAAEFAGRTRVARQRAVHEVLASEFEGGLHALSMVLRSPEEHRQVS